MKPSNRLFTGAMTAGTSSFRWISVPSKESTATLRLAFTGWMPIPAWSSAGLQISPGQVAHYTVAPDGGVLATGRLGTEVQVYSQSSPDDAFSLSSAGRRAPTNWSRLPPTPLVLPSCTQALGKPGEVYLAEGPDKLQTARPLTALTSGSPSAICLRANLIAGRRRTA